MIMFISILFFALQLWFCYKGYETAKLVSVYACIGGFVFCILLGLGIFGKWGSEEPAHQVLAVIIAGIDILACLDIAAARIVYKIYLKITQRYI
ncbi:MAG: hypothetical protein LUD77_05075 [Clostridiales bacterium]|nr:hypothetical protein [Clostridiales bacterium]